MSTSLVREECQSGEVEGWGVLWRGSPDERGDSSLLEIVALLTKFT